MKNKLYAGAAVVLSTGSAFAGGLDRSYTPVDLLFQEGNYAEFRLGYVDPSLDGKDIAGFKTGNVAKTYTNLGAGVKLDVNDAMSVALIFDQPYGVDVKYKDRSPVLGNTRAKAKTNALTFLMRYKFNDNFSVYGGPRVVRADGRIKLSGLAYGPVSNYDVDFGKDTGVGVVAGAAYERPDIALRVALTYHSRTKLSMETTETFPVGFPNPLVPGGVPLPTGNTTVKTPQSVKLEFQTGVAKDTLVFGSARWSEWSEFELVPQLLGANLAQLDDRWNFELGAGHKFTDRFAASMSFNFEPKKGDDLVSPLSPTNGSFGVTIGGRYDLTEKVTLSSGVRYTWLKDAKPETGTPDVERANFKNNHAISYGMKIGYKF